MSLSTASILLHAFLLLATMVSGAATSSIPLEHGDVNTTTFTNSSATSPDSDNFEMYYCYLCTGRYPLLIHRCPIYWDYCHLICDYPPTADADAVDAAAIPSTETTAAPAAPVSPSSSSLGSAAAAHTMVEIDNDCYVMKRYISGRYVIVQRLPCRYAAWCFLTCGGGELVADRNVIMGKATTAAIQGSFLPVDDDAELCGTQVNAPWAPPSGGGGVPAGGAHRRR